MAWTIDDGNYEGKWMMATFILLGVVDMFCVIVRLYSRYLQSSYPALHDYALLLGFVMSIGMIVIGWAVFSHGYGLDVSEFTPDDAVISSRLFASTNIVWNGATTLIRFSMLLFCRQIFWLFRSFTIASIILIIVNFMSFLAIFLTSFLICRPLSYVYVRVGDGYCGDVKSFETYMAIATFVLDACVVLLPMPFLWKLQLRSSKKWGLTAIMGMGIFICSLTLFRLIASYVYMPNNTTKQAAITIFITTLEPLLGIIVACLPFFPRFLDHVHNSHFFARLATWFGKPTHDPRSLAFSHSSSKNLHKPQGNLFMTNNYNCNAGTDNASLAGFPRSGSISSQTRLLRYNQQSLDEASNIYVLQDFRLLEERRYIP